MDESRFEVKVGYHNARCGKVFLTIAPVGIVANTLFAQGDPCRSEREKDGASGYGFCGASTSNSPLLAQRTREKWGTRSFIHMGGFFRLVRGLRLRPRVFRSLKEATWVENAF